MNESDQPPAEPNGASVPSPEAVSTTPDVTRLADPTPIEIPPLFERTDWSSFAITTALTLAVYLCTLAPEVTLEYSGILSTGAKYAGVPHPPGYPLWTLYAWIFTKLLPFSNVAWRLAVSSAVAAALACGILALMVSRGAAAILEGIPGFKRLEPNEERLLRVVCGCAAGMLLGLDRAFWTQAVIVETWPLTWLLFAGVLCVLMRWSYAPEQSGYVCAASLVYGLALSNGQSLVVAALGLEFIILFGNAALGRDLMFATALLVSASLLAHAFGILPQTLANGSQMDSISGAYTFVAIIAALAAAAAAAKTRSFLTRWKSTLALAFSLLLGLSVYFYLPITSMTNPPMNWAYPRTAEGFFHAVTRGQYERIHPTDSLSRFAEQIGAYCQSVISDFGFIGVIAAAVPFSFLHRMRASERGWIFGLTATFLCLSLFLLAMLNPSSDRGTQDMVAVFFCPSRLVLAMWAGYGLTLLGTILARQRNPRDSPI